MKIVNELYVLRIIMFALLVIVSFTTILSPVFSTCLMSGLWLIATIIMAATFDAVTGLLMGCAMLIGIFQNRYVSKTIEKYIVAEESITEEESDVVQQRRVVQRIVYDNSFLGVLAYNADKERVFDGITPLPLDEDDRPSEEFKSGFTIVE